jgi:putative membrane protein
MGSQLLLHEAAGWHWWFAPFWILSWVVLIVVVFRFSPWRGRRDRRTDARSILAERFARGEIDAAEYASRRDVLSQ